MDMGIDVTIVFFLHGFNLFQFDSFRTLYRVVQVQEETYITVYFNT